jgi:hypothetical protein
VVLTTCLNISGEAPVIFRKVFLFKELCVEIKEPLVNQRPLRVLRDETEARFSKMPLAFIFWSERRFQAMENPLAI